MFPCLEHPAGWICARYKFVLLLLLLLWLWCDVQIIQRPDQVFWNIPQHISVSGAFILVKLVKKKSNMTFCHHLFSCLWHNEIKAETFTVLMSEHNSWFLLSMDAFTVILPEGFKPFVLFLVYSGILCAINNFCIHILYACLYALFLCFPELHPTFLWFNSLISYWFNSDTIQFFIVLSH